MSPSRLDVPPFICLASKKYPFGFPFYKRTAFIYYILYRADLARTRCFFDFSTTVGLSLELEALSWAEYPTLTDCPTDQKQFDNNRAPGIIYSSRVLSVNVLSNLISEKIYIEKYIGIMIYLHLQALLAYNCVKYRKKACVHIVLPFNKCILNFILLVKGFTYVFNINIFLMYSIYRIHVYFL